jgi:transposase
MPPAIPNSVRDLMVTWRHEYDMNPTTIARLARCKKSAVYKILHQHRSTGSAHILTRGLRPYVVDDEDLLFLQDQLQLNPCRYLDELQKSLYIHRGKDVSLATLSRTLHRAGLSYKGVSKVSAQRDELLRATWRVKYGCIPHECWVWLDESGIDPRERFRTGGWSIVGRACVRKLPFLRGTERVTLLPALTYEGIIAMELLEGSVTKERFLQFLRVHLVRHSSLSKLAAI